MKQKNYEKGITLIALVVTIIILLILAGVTTYILINQGIIDKSEIAVDEYKISEYKEHIEVIKMGEHIRKISDKLPQSLKELVVDKLESKENESWVKTVETSEEDAGLEENQIKVITKDGYIIVAEIEEDGTITYITIEKDNGEPYPNLAVEVLPLEGKENEKIKIQVKAEVEKIKKTKKIAKIELIKDGIILETRSYNDSKVEDIFEVEENGTYKIKAITDQEKSTTKKAIVNTTIYITYDLNDGTDGPELQTSINGTFVISLKKPERQGYAFLGWSTLSTATQASYQPGETFITNSDTTLYAIWILNEEPIISSTSVYARNTNYITVRANATDADKDELTYKLYLKTENGEYPATPNATSSATASGTNVDLQATGLSTYTVYNYKVEVTDGKTVVTSSEGTTGTGCDGTGLTCTAASSVTCGTYTQSGYSKSVCSNCHYESVVTVTTRCSGCGIERTNCELRMY